MARGRQVLSIVFSLMMLVSALGCDGHSADREDIKNNFTTFFDAFAKHDGQTAAGLLTNASLAWYKNVVDKAVTTPADQLLKMKPSLVYEILVVRLFAKPDDLKGLTGAQFFSRAVSRGWYDHELVVKRTFGRVLSFTGEAASVQILSDGEAEESPWVFRKEDGYWKLDQDATRAEDDRQWIKAIAQQGWTLKEEFEEMFEPIVGAERVKKMWDPMTSE